MAKGKSTPEKKEDVGTPGGQNPVIIAACIAAVATIGTALINKGSIFGPAAENTPVCANGHPPRAEGGDELKLGYCPPRHTGACLTALPPAGEVRGSCSNGSMVGQWNVTNSKGDPIWSGSFNSAGGPNGHWTIKDENGTSQGDYDVDRQGTWTVWINNGRPRRLVGQYQHGRRVGRVKMYDADGTLRTLTELFPNGETKSQTTYCLDGASFTMDYKDKPGRIAKLSIDGKTEVNDPVETLSKERMQQYKSILDAKCDPLR